MPKFWITPNKTVLNNTIVGCCDTVLDGNGIANALTRYGLPSMFLSVCHTASVSTYHFDLNDIRRGSDRNISQALKLLSMQIKKEATRAKTKTGHYAIQIPRDNRQTVSLLQAMTSGDEFLQATSNHKVSTAFGLTTENKSMWTKISDMPHMLISGSTGSGKSVLLNSMICSMLFRCTPVDLNLTLIDVKRTELTQYNGIPHLTQPVITDVEQAINALKTEKYIMDERYRDMEENVWKLLPDQYATRVIIIDEFAVLMSKAGNEFEELVCEIAAKARAAKIHLILATQTPNSDVITKQLRVNIPTRIALKVSTSTDSRISTGMTGTEAPKAEKLLGQGDGYYINGIDVIRFQSAYTSEEEIEAIINHWKK